jgi:hypothetical protein
MAVHDREYKGFKLERSPQTLLFDISTADGSPLPQQLHMKFTTFEIARATIDHYLDWEKLRKQGLPEGPKETLVKTRLPQRRYTIPVSV